MNSLSVLAISRNISMFEKGRNFVKNKDPSSQS